MSKIKIEDVEYTLYTDELSRYDGYYFKGEIHKYEPVDSRVIGYVKEDSMKIAICKATHKKALSVYIRRFWCSNISSICYVFSST